MTTQNTDYPGASRWTDNPFQPPNASPELLDYYAKREEATKVWRETGDDSGLIELGLFPTKEEQEKIDAMSEEEFDAFYEEGERQAEQNLREAELDDQLDETAKMIAKARKVVR